MTGRWFILGLLVCMAPSMLVVGVMAYGTWRDHQRTRRVS